MATTRPSTSRTTRPGRSRPPGEGSPAISPTEVALALWPVAQISAQYQRAGRYLPACTAHPGKMLPSLAARIITEYSTPGQLVLDPMCGIGTTLIEAASQERRVIGVELEPRWAELALANLEAVLTPEQCLTAEVRTGDAQHLTTVLADAVGFVDLIVVSPPYACAAGIIDKPTWTAGGRLCPPDTLNYSTDRGNVGHARGPAYTTAMAAVYAGCLALLRPGGLLVTVTKNTRSRGRTFDLAGTTVVLAQTAGFTYLQHVIALHAAICDSGLRARPSFWALTQHRHAARRGEPAHLVVHEDVSVFAKPESTMGSRKLKDPHSESTCAPAEVSR